MLDKESNVATLHLPKNSAVQVVSVRGEDNSSLKRIVCLEACKMLHQVGALNDYLLPHSDSSIDSDDDLGQYDGMFLEFSTNYLVMVFSKQANLKVV